MVNDKVERLTLDSTELENIRIEADRFLRFFDNLREEVRNNASIDPKSSSVVMSRRSSQDLSRLLKDFRGMLSPKKK